MVKKIKKYLCHKKRLICSFDPTRNEVQKYKSTPYYQKELNGESVKKKHLENFYFLTK
jgi:hypothetical protein